MYTCIYIYTNTHPISSPTPRGNTCDVQCLIHSFHSFTLLIHLFSSMQPFQHHPIIKLPSGNLTSVWKDPPFLLGKLTISMAIFNS